VTDAAEALMPLFRHARSIAERMRDVEGAEADYAFALESTGTRGSGRAVLAAPKRWRADEPAFAKLADAVEGLCSAWQLFRLGAAAEGLTWRAALELTLPSLFGDGSQPEVTLRQDTVFSYAVVRSDEDIMKCFRWRLAKGYC